MHVLENGICVTCRPAAVRASGHVLANGECVTCRSTASRNFNPSLHPHDPHNGEFVSTGGVVHDLLDLAGRIHLGRGEHLASSGKLETSSGYDVDVVHAVIESADGKRIRLGIIPSDDIGKWTAANKGGTVDMSPRQAAHLRDDLTEANKAAKASAKKADAAWAAGKTPDLTRPVVTGSVGSSWGDLHYETYLTDDDPTSWLTSLQVAGASETADPAQLTPKDLGKFIKLLDGLV